jgi:hypothetical protein
MRVFLFCIDALEYDFVVDRDYPNIKQVQAEKVHIPLNCMTQKADGLITPFTPVMWKQILTGRLESESVTEKPERYKNSVLNWLTRRSIARGLYKFLISTGLIRRGLPLRSGFERKNILEGEESLLTVAKNPIILQNPVIAEVKWAGIKTGEFKPFEILDKFVDIFEEERMEVLERMKEDWDLLLFFTKLLDTSGHLLWGRDDYIKKYYNKIEKLAGEIKESLPSDAVMITLSDHGMTLLPESRIGGRHSHNAFMSMSHPAQIPEYFNILHIRGIIEEFMGKIA